MAKTVKKITYIVLDYQGGKYWPVGTYDNPEEAEANRKPFGYKAKIKIVKR
jgi:hypothetical protein